jgi:hypothetical protein
MAVPTVFSPVLKQDFTLNPVEVHKKYVVSKVDLFSGSASVPITGSGYKILTAIYPTEKLKLGTDSVRLYPTNSFDGSYQHILWKSIDSRFYRFPYDRCATLEHANPRYTFKYLGMSASIFQIPSIRLGEGIKPGSVAISNEDYSISIRDDGNGNLYDSTTNSSSFSDASRLAGYWSFDAEFRNHPLNDNVSSGKILYRSKLFQVDSPSEFKNLKFANPNDIDGSGGFKGLCASFNGTSSIVTANRSEFNFDGDFSIAFFVHAPATQSNSNNTIVSKCAIIQKQVSGINEKLNVNGLLVSSNFISSSKENILTNVFPYKFELTNYNHATQSGIVFSRSDGTNTSVLHSTSVGGSGWSHIALTKSGSLLSIYKNGSLSMTGSDSTSGCNNSYDLVFGAIDDVARNQFSGSIDEIRFYDYALTSTQIGTLSSTDFVSIQTSVVGNVFYKSGLVVISPYNSGKFDLTFDASSAWSIEYKSTHTIYEYEALCRVKKGSFNLSQNPSARQTPNSDLLLNDFTGSLMPYATSIGLYNDKGELMAVAKLGQSIQMRDDVDLNFLVKMDA